MKAEVEITQIEGVLGLKLGVGDYQGEVKLNRPMSMPEIGLLHAWALAHVERAERLHRVWHILVEVVVAGLVATLLLAVVAGLAWACWRYPGHVAQGAAGAATTMLLGVVIRYFESSRSILRKLTGGKLFR